MCVIENIHLERGHMKQTKRVKEILDVLTAVANEDEWLIFEIGSSVTADSLYHLLYKKHTLGHTNIHRKIQTDSIRRTLKNMEKAGMIYSTSEIIEVNAPDGHYCNRRVRVYRIPDAEIIPTIQENVALEGVITGNSRKPKRKIMSELGMFSEIN